MSEHPRRLSALVVNHDSGAWALRCVESLQREWERAGRAPRDLELIVVDSGSNPAESTWWRSLRRAGARVKTSPANVGYAAGLDMAYRLSSGGPEDVVALLNPDLYFPPGSLEPLLARLEEEPRLGAVGPRLFLDEERALRLPQNLLPTPARELGEALAARWPRLARALAASRSRRAHAFWSEEGPQRVEMLSGACLFLRRGVVEELGAPMDVRFPLYFEDADLCARLAARGRGLELVPASEVLHHWSRSAGPDFEGEVALRHAFGRRLWMRLHHRGPWKGLLLALGAWAQRRSAKRGARPMHALEPLGVLRESPTIELPRREGAPGGAFVLELSLTPWWGLAAGVLVEGERYALPARSWSWLYPGTYYLRVLDAASGAVLGAWSFEKQSPARSWPLEASTFEMTGRRAATPRVGERVG